MQLFYELLFPTRGRFCIKCKHKTVEHSGAKNENCGIGRLAALLNWLLSYVNVVTHQKHTAKTNSLMCYIVTAAYKKGEPYSLENAVVYGRPNG